ncbi:hypothetical protein ig2599ANME_0842 [groundwater metagenome]
MWTESFDPFDTIHSADFTPSYLFSPHVQFSQYPALCLESIKKQDYPKEKEDLELADKMIKEVIQK